VSSSFCRLVGALLLAGLSAGVEATVESGPGPTSSQLVLPAMERQFEQACESGDWAAAKAVDLQMARAQADLAGQPTGTLNRGIRISACRDLQPPVVDDWDRDVAVDTGIVTAFDVATDSAGRFWAAVAHPNGEVRILASDDDGRTWGARFLLQPGSAVTKLELVPAQGESGFVFLFFLEQSQAGDLWLMRIAGDTASGALPVCVGPDTIDDFSAVCDRDSHYYLYCLYANEHSTGRTGAFMRSVDYGLTWGSATDWWNGWDPRLSCTSGSTIHCAWRYAATGTQIHYTFNRHYGAAGYWSWQRVVSTGGDKCWDPVVAQADTYPEWRAPVWVFYTVGRRDTSQRDIIYSYSLNDGDGWSPGHSFSDPYIDEWAADLKFDAGQPGGFIGLCYNYGGGRSGDSATVYLRLGSAGDSTYWTHPLAVNAAPAGLGTDVTGPELVYSHSGSARAPAVVYCRASALGSDGLYITAPWLNRTAPDTIVAPALDCGPNPARAGAVISFNVTSAGRYTLNIYNAAGMKVDRLVPAAVQPGTRTCSWDSRGHPVGTYFVELVGQNGTRRARLTLIGKQRF